MPEWRSTLLKCETCAHERGTVCNIFKVYVVKMYISRINFDKCKYY